MPTPGRLERFVPPGGPFTRVDTHGRAGDLVGPHYDSLMAKVIVWAPDRDQALARMDRALDEFDIAGTAGCTHPHRVVRRLLDDPGFRKGRSSTGLVEAVARRPSPREPIRPRGLPPRSTLDGGTPQDDSDDLHP